MASFTITMLQDAQQKSHTAQNILTALPQWFGIPESLNDYVQNAAQRPFVAAVQGGEVLGFLTLTRHNPHTYEIDVMGVLPQHHRNGIGRAMVTAALDYCKQQQATFLTVKTLDESAHSEEYDRSRAFYLQMGFIPLELFPTLWGEANPCLMLAHIL